MDRLGLDYLSISVKDLEWLMLAVVQRIRDVLNPAHVVVKWSRPATPVGDAALGEANIATERRVRRPT